MQQFESPIPGLGINALAQEIQAKIGELYATGALDSEPTTLEQLLTGLLSGHLSPEEVRAQLTALLASRQDYH
jgi:hypothetical protein